MKLKKRMTLWLLCWRVFAQGATPNKEKSSTTEKDIFIDNLLDKMTLDEKIGQLYQCSGQGNLTGPDTLHLSIDDYIRQGKIGTMLNVTGIKNIKNINH